MACLTVCLSLPPSFPASPPPSLFLSSLSLKYIKLNCVRIYNLSNLSDSLSYPTEVYSYYVLTSDMVLGAQTHSNYKATYNFLGKKEQLSAHENIKQESSEIGCRCTCSGMKGHTKFKQKKDPNENF